MSSYGPYSPIYKAGNFFFISGQVGIDPATKEAGESIKLQAEQALKNLQAVLEDEGLDMGSVVKTTIFLKNIDDYNSMNDVYMKHFPHPRPARSCVGVSELPKIGSRKLLVEIEAVAVKAKKS